MRTQNSLKNASVGVLGHVLTLLFSFVSRSVFIYALGSQYLGLSGLFTSILMVLSLSELGFGSAIVYSMYKPLAQRDTAKVQALLHLYKTAYRVIGLVILVLGVCAVPLLPYIIKDAPPDVNITLIFLLYVLRSVLSYWFFAYRRAIISADQKSYVLAPYTYATTVATTISDIVILLFFHNFELYLAAQILISALSNLFVARKAGKMYPYILEPPAEKLSKVERKGIVKNVYGLFMYKISGIVLNTTDNIVLSTFIGLAVVGLYSNYLLIISSVTVFLERIFGGFTASIGNLDATESPQKKHFIFECLNFLNFWLYGFCGICFWVLVNPFITLWIGKSYLLDFGTTLVIALNMLTAGLQQAVIAFKDGCGLFWQGRYRALISALINVVLSVLFVHFWGIFGVLLATVISRMVSTWWFDPWMIHKYAFQTGPARYYLKYLRSLAVISVCGAGLYALCSLFPLSWPGFLGMAALCVIVPNALFFLLFHKTKEFQYIWGAARSVLAPVLAKFRRHRS